MSSASGHYVDRFTGRALCTAGPMCGAQAEYLVGYTYVTGRAGRTTSTEKPACLEHARRFADKHGLAEVARELELRRGQRA